MLERKKILYLITKSNWGGAQRYVYDIATSLPKDRFETVVALGGNGELAKKLTEAGIRTIVMPELQRDISMSKELRAFRHLWRIVGDEKPDVFHVNSSKAGGIGALVGRLRGVPKIVYSAHGWAFNEDRSSIARFVIGFFHWLTVMLSHTTIAVSNATKYQMRWPLAQRKIVVVQNGRPETPFCTREEAREKCVKTAPALAPYKDEFWTGTIAELHPVKRHDVVIEAIAKLRDEGLILRHIIVGTGELKEKLEKLIGERNLSGQVFMLGHIDEAARFLRAFDIFILPSRSEALAYTVIEAAQAGLPIVASRVGGLPEIITNEWDGILIRSGDVKVMADTLRSLKEDATKRERLAKAAQTRGGHFSLERMVFETTAVYKL